MARNVSGWLRQAPDPRDRQHVVRRAVLATLPDYFDLSSGMGPQLDQGDLGSCGPNTADECITFEQKVQGIPVAAASRLFIYYTTRFLMGTVDQDSGVDNRTMLKALAGYGFPAESLWPYDVSLYKTRPPQSVIDAAAKNKIVSYAAVAKDLATMKGTLVSGDPFIFGFDVFNQMMGDECALTGIVSDPAGPRQGGHDVTFVGFSNVERPGVMPGNRWPANTFKFRNHWTENGRPWGDGGYGYLSYAYATGANADDFWVINAVPGGVVPPPTPVPPTPGPVVNMTGYAQIPILGKSPIYLTSQTAVVGLPSFDVWALILEYGRKVAPIVIADVMAGKDWKAIVADVLKAIAA